MLSGMCTLKRTSNHAQTTATCALRSTACSAVSPEHQGTEIRSQEPTPCACAEAARRFQTMCLNRVVLKASQAAAPNNGHGLCLPPLASHLAQN